MVQIADMSIVKEALSQLFDEKFKSFQQPKSTSTNSDFVGDKEARQILSGSEKPVSKPTFNNFRKRHDIKTYYSSNQRIIFSCQEIIEAIKTTKK